MPVLPLLAALTFALAGGGCGRQTGTTVVDAGAPKARSGKSAPLILAYVRLAALESQHPLQKDVQRLRNAERRLAGLVPGMRTGSDREDPYELPAVGTQVDRQTAIQVAAALETRRLRERALLEKRTAAQLGAFLGGISYRQDRLLDQRHAELQAVGQAEQDKLARSLREAAAEEARSEVVKRSDEKVNRQLPVAVLSKQLRPDPEFVNDVLVPGPVVDAENLQKEIARLTADPKAKFVPERARFIVNLREARKRLADLQAEINQIIASTDQSASDRIQAAQNARIAEIGIELEGLRGDAETLALYRGQRTALANALAAESDLTARTASFQGLSGESQEGAGSVRFASLFGVKPDASGSVTRVLDLQRALERVRRQRARLQKFIGVDVHDFVRDAAENHQIDIAFAPAAGRRDMTAQFAAWLQGYPSENTSKGNGRDLGRGVSGG